MQKQTTATIRVSAEAAQRAREAGLCLSKTASKALLEAAELLENKTLPKEGDRIC